MRYALPVLAVFALPLLAGCVAEEPPEDIRAFGVLEGFYTSGYNVAGAPAFPLEGPGYLEVSPTDGTVFAYGFLHGLGDWSEIYMPPPTGTATAYTIDQDVEVHGDARLPRLNAEVAVYGPMVFHNGEDARPFEMAAGDLVWDAELLLLADGIRHDETRILTADETALWDPLEPEDVNYQRGQRELHVILTSRQSAKELFPDPIVTTTGSITLGGEERNRSFTSVHAQATGELRFVVTADSGAAMMATDAEASLYAPDGTLVARVAAGGASTATTEAVAPVSLPVPGTYALRIDGSGPGAQYEASIAYTMDEVVFHVWWEGVYVGEDADRAVEKMTGFMRERIETLRD